MSNYSLKRTLRDGEIEDGHAATLKWVMKKSYRKIVLFMTLVSGNFAYGQTNLLLNGDFSAANQLSGWQVAASDGSVIWNSDSADASSASGSVEIDSNTFGGSIQSSCFSMTSPQGYIGVYSYGGQTKAIQPSNLGYVMQCTAYLELGCTGTALNLYSLNAIPPFWQQFDVWEGMDTTSGRLPTVASSASCVIAIENAIPVRPFGAIERTTSLVSVRFDNLFFVIEHDELYKDGFEF